ncbi:MAG TPA: CHAT domain-containing protein [Methanotrichaceae archaeon]|nr:CHAT domain-containing protein [Methanotrichaceae archaeon]HQF16353.1 CHAT domain-containing protein [Methanotrichaceae archaeon]HQI91033.1 CHAT domain-containing protein [Methanotrichaceae archaeon]
MTENSKTVHDAVTSFIRSGSWEDAARIVESHGYELLTDDADTVIADEIRIGEYKHEYDAVSMLQLKRWFLIQCRREGPKYGLKSITDLGNLMELEISLEKPDEMSYKIEICHKILDLIDRDILTKIWGCIHEVLGESYAKNKHNDIASNLEHAIEHYNLALEAITSEIYPHLWATTQMHLGIAYTQRIEGQRADNLENAIEHLKLALSIFSRDVNPDDWSMVQSNLSTAYLYRIYGNRSDNLERAIRHSQLGLELTDGDGDSSLWSDLHLNLGLAYSSRIKGDRADNLEQALVHYHLTKYDPHKSPENWAKLKNNLAFVLMERAREGLSDSLDLAIDQLNLALQMESLSYFKDIWASTHNNLGGALLQKDSLANPEEAIKHFEAASTVYTRSNNAEKWAMVQSNLAAAYMNSAAADPETNEKAIEHFQNALDVYTREAFPLRWAMVHNNLGRLYAQCKNDNANENMNRSKDHFEQALTVFTTDQLPSERLKTINELAALYFKNRIWDKALEAYDEAITIGDALFEAAYTEKGRQMEIRKTSEIYANSAYCLLKLGNREEAILRLEKGKTRQLANALALSDIHLANLSEDQEMQILSSRRRVRELEAEMRESIDTPNRRQDAELGKALREELADLNYLIEHYRRKDPNFLHEGLELPEILELIPEGGALVMPFSTQHGGAAFVLPSGIASIAPDTVIMIDKFTDSSLQDILIGSSNKPGWLNSYIAWQNRGVQEEFERAMDELAAHLWSVLMSPIYERLEEIHLNRGAPLILVPLGALGLLPLHAAWYQKDGEKRTILDDYSVSYAPSAYVLKISRQRMQDSRRNARTLLDIVNPTADLPFATIEGKAVADLFKDADKHLIIESEANAGAVKEHGPHYAYLHFSGHGRYNWDKAERSAIILADGVELTLAEIMSPDFDFNMTRLVTLSACETGFTEFLELPNEYIGLPAGFLQAGAPAVVSSLWAVNDLSTALLMEHFYNNHLDNNMDLAAALRDAQLWLRDLKATDVAEILSGYYAEADETSKAILLQYRNYYSSLANRDTANPKPFVHPYYWAGFTLNGT